MKVSCVGTVLLIQYYYTTRGSAPLLISEIVLCMNTHSLSNYFVRSNLYPSGCYYCKWKDSSILNKTILLDFPMHSTFTMENHHRLLSFWQRGSHHQTPFPSWMTSDLTRIGNPHVLCSRFFHPKFFEALTVPNAVGEVAHRGSLELVIRSHHCVSNRPSFSPS